MTTRLLFICLGNIIRSPLSEAVMRDKVRKSKLDHRYHIESRGTGSWHQGEAADPRTIEVARNHQIDLAMHRAKQLRGEDFAKFDLFLVMDFHNHEEVLRLLQQRNGIDSEKIIRDQLFFLRKFDSCKKTDQDAVPDPYYTNGLVAFEDVFKIIDRSCDGLLRHLQGNE